MRPPAMTSVTGGETLPAVGEAQEGRPLRVAPSISRTISAYALSADARVIAMSSAPSAFAAPLRSLHRGVGDRQRLAGERRGVDDRLGAIRHHAVRRDDLTCADDDLVSWHELFDLDLLHERATTPVRDSRCPFDEEPAARVGRGRWRTLRGRCRQRA